MNTEAENYAIRKGFEVNRVDADDTVYLSKRRRFVTVYVEIDAEGRANGEADFKAEIDSLLAQL